MSTKTTELIGQKVPACIRTGRCCERIMITVSPATLRSMVQNGNGRPLKCGDLEVDLKDDQSVSMIYDMLGDRCIGKFRRNGVTYYVYGPCRNLSYETVGDLRVGKCKAHAFKPKMCSDYPYYGNPPFDEAPYMKGCGYQTSDRGILPEWLTPEVLTRLLPEEM